MIIRSLGAEFFHVDQRIYRRTDRQTDRHDAADIRFSQFRETPYKYYQLQNSIIRHI